MITLPQLMARAIDAGLVLLEREYPWSLSYRLTWEQMDEMYLEALDLVHEQQVARLRRQLHHWHGPYLGFTTTENHLRREDVYVYTVTAHYEPPF